MKRKQKIFIAVNFSVLLIFCLLIAKRINEKFKAEAIITNIPKFSFLLQSRHSFSNKDIDNTKPRIIINHFSPTCEHCQYMAIEFLKDSQKLKNVQILMITSADSLSAANFNNDYKLSLLPNIEILRDTNYQFQKLFGTGVVPTFFIYEQNKLIKNIKGETRLENLID